MNIELKRFTTNARLSQETTAFAADVWVDGKKAGTAENDGHGGATLVHLHLVDPTVRAKIEAYGAALVPEAYKRFTSGTEWVVDRLVEAALLKKEADALAKRLAKVDTKEKAVATKQGLRCARYRAGDTWRWFFFGVTTTAETAAATLATAHKRSVDELVVVS